MDNLHYLLDELLKQKESKKSKIANIGFLVAILLIATCQIIPLLILHSTVLAVIVPSVFMFSLHWFNKKKSQNTEQQLKEQLTLELQKKEVQDYLHLIHDYVLIKNQIIPKQEKSIITIDNLIEHVKNNSSIYQSIVREKFRVETLEALIKKEVRNNIELFKNNLPLSMKKDLNKQALKL